jgi:hypothetical protein
MHARILIWMLLFVYLFPLLAQAKVEWKTKEQVVRASLEQTEIAASFEFQNTGSEPVTITDIKSF